jgi:hypothetical protein
VALRHAIASSTLATQHSHKWLDGDSVTNRNRLMADGLAEFLGTLCDWEPDTADD